MHKRSVQWAADWIIKLGEVPGAPRQRFLCISPRGRLCALMNCTCVGVLLTVCPNLFGVRIISRHVKKQSSFSPNYRPKIFWMPVHKSCGRKKARVPVPVRVEQLTSSYTPAPSWGLVILQTRYCILLSLFPSLKLISHSFRISVVWP